MAASKPADPSRRSHPNEGSLATEIGKRGAFDTPEEEAYLNIVRTAAELEGGFRQLFKDHHLSSSTYNVMRILRGSGALPGARGRPSTEIGRDLVVRTPDVTRLVDRLIRLGFAERVACPDDRRVTYVRLTHTGVAKLSELDGPVRELNRAQLGALTRGDLAEINRLMISARRACAGRTP